MIVVDNHWLSLLVRFYEHGPALT